MNNTMIKRGLIFVGMSLTGMALVLTGCKQTDVKNKQPEVVKSTAIQVKTMQLTEREVSRSINYTANLSPFEEVYCAPAAPGRIEKINVEIGSYVSKGSILVQMDQTQLKQAEIQLKTLETDYNRIKQLHDMGSIAEQQYDQIKAQYEVAQTNVQFLKENTQLLAPIGGVITGKYFENGELYSGAPNTAAGKAAVVTIQQINPVKAFINVSESYFPVINKNTKVELLCELFPSEKFEGSVYRIYPTIDAISRTFTIEIAIPNKNEKLRPGMYGTISLDVENATSLMVPAIAVLKQQGTNERLVYKVEDGKAKRILVETGVRYDDLVEIHSKDLKLTDHIIIVGQSKVVDGSSVEVIQ
jgi:RND family efflux transporter MFP subunit